MSLALAFYYSNYFVHALTLSLKLHAVSAAAVLAVVLSYGFSGAHTALLALTTHALPAHRTRQSKQLAVHLSPLAPRLPSLASPSQGSTAAAS